MWSPSGVGIIVMCSLWSAKVLRCPYSHTHNSPCTSAFQLVLVIVKYIYIYIYTYIMRSLILSIYLNNYWLVPAFHVSRWWFHMSCWLKTDRYAALTGPMTQWIDAVADDSQYVRSSRGDDTQAFQVQKEPWHNLVKFEIISLTRVYLRVWRSRTSSQHPASKRTTITQLATQQTSTQPARTQQAHSNHPAS